MTASRQAVQQDDDARDGLTTAGVVIRLRQMTEAIERQAVIDLGRHLFACPRCSKVTNYRCPDALVLRDRAARLASEGRRGIR